MTAIPRQVPIFRLIHLDNLSVCLQRGGLHAPNHEPRDGLKYKPIHSVEIQNERKDKPIACGPKGTIHDYVPFYFGMRSPMLLQLYTGQVDGYNEGQSPIIYVVSSVATIHTAGLQYIFTDGHGIAAYTQWYDDLSHLTAVDWSVVYATYWSDTVDDPDRQRRKQAEFLIYQSCPWQLVNEIGVINGVIQGQVSRILAKFGASTPVGIHRDWYY